MKKKTTLDILEERLIVSKIRNFIDECVLDKIDYENLPSGYEYEKELENITRILNHFDEKLNFPYKPNKYFKYSIELTFLPEDDGIQIDIPVQFKIIGSEEFDDPILIGICIKHKSISLEGDE